MRVVWSSQALDVMSRLVSRFGGELGRGHAQRGVSDRVSRGS